MSEKEGHKKADKATDVALETYCETFWQTCLASSSTCSCGGESSSRAVSSVRVVCNKDLFQ